MVERFGRSNFKNCLILIPVRHSMFLLTAKAAKTSVRWASIDSRVWWKMGLALRSDFAIRKVASTWKRWKPGYLIPRYCVHFQYGWSLQCDLEPCRRFEPLSPHLKFWLSEWMPCLNSSSPRPSFSVPKFDFLISKMRFSGKSEQVRFEIYRDVYPALHQINNRIYNRFRVWNSYLAVNGWHFLKIDYATSIEPIL